MTDVSGRGVGMDAVRVGIERLGGRVTVRGGVGTGTTIRFLLPLTVMMTRVMIVEAGTQIFGVPFEAVVETLQLDRDLIAASRRRRGFCPARPLRYRSLILPAPSTSIAGIGSLAVAKIVVDRSGQPSRRPSRSTVSANGWTSC